MTSAIYKRITIGASFAAIVTMMGFTTATPAAAQKAVTPKTSKTTAHKSHSVISTQEDKAGALKKITTASRVHDAVDNPAIFSEASLDGNISNQNLLTTKQVIQQLQALGYNRVIEFKTSVYDMGGAVIPGRPADEKANPIGLVEFLEKTKDLPPAQVNEAFAVGYHKTLVEYFAEVRDVEALKLLAKAGYNLSSLKVLDAVLF